MKRGNVFLSFLRRRSRSRESSFFPSLSPRRCSIFSFPFSRVVGIKCFLSCVTGFSFCSEFRVFSIIHAGSLPLSSSCSAADDAVAADAAVAEEDEEEGTTTLRRLPTLGAPYSSAHRPSNAATILRTTSSKKTLARWRCTADLNSKLTEKETQVVLAGRGPSEKRQRQSRWRKREEPEAGVRTEEGGVRVTQEV